MEEQIHYTRSTEDELRLKQKAAQLANQPDAEELLEQLEMAIRLQKIEETKNGAASLTAILSEMTEEIAQLRQEIALDRLNKNNDEASWVRLRRKSALEELQKMIESLDVVYPQAMLALFTGLNDSKVLDPTRLTVDSLLDTRKEVLAFLERFNRKVVEIAERDTNVRKASLRYAIHYVSVVLAMTDGFLSFALTPNMQALEELGDNPNQRARDITKLFNDELHPQDTAEAAQVQKKVKCAACGTIYFLTGDHYSCPSCTSNAII